MDEDVIKHRLNIIDSGKLSELEPIQSNCSITSGGWSAEGDFLNVKYRGGGIFQQNLDDWGRFQQNLLTGGNKTNDSQTKKQSAGRKYLSDGEDLLLKEISSEITNEIASPETIEATVLAPDTSPGEGKNNEKVGRNIKHSSVETSSAEQRKVKKRKKLKPLAKSVNDTKVDKMIATLYEPVKCIAADQPLPSQFKINIQLLFTPPIINVQMYRITGNVIVFYLVGDYKINCENHNENRSLATSERTFVKVKIIPYGNKENEEVDKQNISVSTEVAKESSSKYPYAKIGVSFLFGAGVVCVGALLYRKSQEAKNKRKAGTTLAASKGTRGGRSGVGVSTHATSGSKTIFVLIVRIIYASKSCKAEPDLEIWKPGASKGWGFPNNFRNRRTRATFFVTKLLVTCYSV
ncbi:hypothetical protein HELRODRAFT_166094 [Helobdella robusta]|uniref:Uncharacterized protein n=1 Tax=Helobdella robusta TaxID=6412 RepID=T1EXR2_HELRO|nr:hypothetical protein HELRODRAFT_166094 [Helobdella robusta]ESN90428.1 hypothetical protein HELRODRAFT_166094 [Helobdella robusta]